MTGLSAVTVRHNFETAHRLPHLGGKCQSLHGHSWWVELTVAVPAVSAAGTVVEFGALKHRLRNWVDANLDHGTMLGTIDPLCPALLAQGCKVYRFGTADPDSPHGLAQDLPWPTVENVAVLLGRVGWGIVSDLAAEGQVTAAGAFVEQVRVSETHVNAATWKPA